MDNNEITLKEINDGLLTILKCSDCSNIMVPPIHMCSKGHNFCTTCRYKLTWCPKCEEEFTGHNYIMEKVAELVIYPCKYASAGCDVKLRLKDKVKHELDDCLLCRLPCLLSHCKLEVSRRDYLQHLNNTHPDSLIVGTDKVVLFSTHQKSESEWVFFVFESFFLFKFTTNSTELQWAVICVGSPEVASQFYYTFSIKDPEDPYQSIQFSGKPSSIEVADGSYFLHFVPLDVLESYCNLIKPNLNSMEIKVHKLP